MKKVKLKIQAILAILFNPTFFLYVSKKDDCDLISHNLSVGDAKAIRTITDDMVEDTISEYQQEQNLAEAKNILNGIG